MEAIALSKSDRTDGDHATKLNPPVGGKRSYCSFVTLLSIFATIGGFVFGYDIGVIGGVKDMEDFKKLFGDANTTEIVVLTNGTRVLMNFTEWSVSAENQGWIVGSFSLGCLVGALVAGAVSDSLGRRIAILMGAIVFTVGGFVQAIAYYLWMVYLGRIVAGFGVGVLSMSVPIYNAEVSPAEKRGQLVSLNQLSITAGIMVSFLVNLACESYVHGWRISLALQCVFSLILFFGMLVAPETPRFLMKKQRRAKALAVLNWIRTGHRKSVACDSDVSPEILEEINSITTELDQASQLGEAKWSELVLHWSAAKRLLIGMWVQLFQQFTGMNIIMYYSTGIFSSIGVSQYVSTAIVGIINFLTTFGTLALVDRVGRKVLLLFGSMGMCIAPVLGAVVITVSGGNDNLNTAQGYLVTIAICVFVFAFALTWGPVAWVVTSEIFPLRLRGKCVSVTTASNWTGNFAIAFFTPILLEPSVLDVQGTLFLMGAFNFVAFFFILLTVPETKGRSLESMDELFNKRSVLDSSDYKFYLSCGCFRDCIHQRQYSELSDDYSSTDSSELLVSREDGDGVDTTETDT